MAIEFLSLIKPTVTAIVNIVLTQSVLHTHNQLITHINCSVRLCVQRLIDFGRSRLPGEEFIGYVRIRKLGAAEIVDVALRIFHLDSQRCIWISE